MENLTTVAPEAVRFLTRRLRESDHAFTYANFLRAYRESDHTEGIPNTEFFDHHKAEWCAVLALFDVLIAHPEGDDDEIAGFVAYSGRVVAWLYTKKHPWRGMGVARLLLEAAGFHPGRPLWALYGSSWALRRARAAGYAVSLVPHGEAVRLLLGARS
jgi:GNAT superfamily N-acetyltransferase